MALEITDFELHAVLRDAVEMVVLKAHEKGLELICQIAPSTPSLLRGDPGRLRQILANLVGNAVKFTHQGEVIVHIDIESSAEQKVTLRFTVSDTGIGIAQNKADRLFLPFVQGDGSPPAGTAARAWGSLSPSNW